MPQSPQAQKSSCFVLRRHCTGFKLVDVPELGYSSKDKPNPRGELRLKTKLMIPGYYKHPKVPHLPCQHSMLHMHASA